MNPIPACIALLLALLLCVPWRLLRPRAAAAQPAIARLRARRRPRSRTDIRQLLHQMSESLRGRLQAAGMALELRLPADPLPVVLDRSGMQEVLCPHRRAGLPRDACRQHAAGARPHRRRPCRRQLHRLPPRASTSPAWRAASTPPPRAVRAGAATRRDRERRALRADRERAPRPASMRRRRRSAASASRSRLPLEQGRRRQHARPGSEPAHDFSQIAAHSRQPRMRFRAGENPR